MLLHASCVAVTNRAVLLTGTPGSGKSDVALRMINEGAQLVADDQTDLSVQNGVLLASAPSRIAGLLEIRHAGLYRLPYISLVPVVLLIELVSFECELERLPEPQAIFFLDHSVQRLRLPAFAASTPAKIRLCLTYQGLYDAGPTG